MHWMYKTTWIAALLIFAGGAFQLQADPGTTGPEAAQAQKAFEQLKSLDGKWIGRSTKGWEEKIIFRVIAGGSAVMETSFDAHPGETMLTLYHLDQDRLMLTHYCIGKNQPRLLATNVKEDGSLIEFEFLDATNLPSRNQGHMDRHTFRIIDEDNAVAHWTWYQDGKDSWTEEVHLQRIVD